MSMPSAVRHINQIRLLQALLRHGPMSRAALARELDMMRSTAGSLVGPLMAEGVIRDASSPPQGREVGRPGARIELNPEHAQFIGADLGIGYIRVLSVDLTGTPVRSLCRTFTPKEADPPRLAHRLAAMVGEITASLAPDVARGLCVSIPGLVDHEGAVRHAAILDWEAVPFAAMLRDLLPGLPVRAENDANAFAQAEMQRLGGAAGGNTLFLWIDAGVGGAILADGHLLRGQNGHAGEFGHLRIALTDPGSAFPVTGRLESFVGREALLLAHAAQGGTAGNLAEFLRAADEGEPAAAGALLLWSDALAQGLSALTSILDPARIVLGGPVAPALARCADRVAERMREITPRGASLPTVDISPLGEDASALGSALILHRAFLAIDPGVVFGARREGFSPSAPAA